MKNLVLTLAVLVSTVSIAQGDFVKIESYPPTHTIDEAEQMDAIEKMSTVFYPIVATNQVKGVEDYTVGYKFQSDDMTKVLYDGNTYAFYTLDLTKDNMISILKEFYYVTESNGVDAGDRATWGEGSFDIIENYDGYVDDYDYLYSTLQNNDKVSVECQIWSHLPDGTPVWIAVKIDSGIFAFKMEVDPVM